jgi:hypothetical protein
MLGALLLGQAVRHGVLILPENSLINELHIAESFLRNCQ